MTSIIKPLLCLAACIVPFALHAQDVPAADLGAMRQVSNHMGEMGMAVEAGDIDIDDALRFEPYQQLEEMFGRDDVVYLMRHGPTDWTKLDAKDVAPGDCDDQRVMIEEGAEDMRDLGTLMAANGVVPSRIVASQWCRNQQTVKYLFEGFDRIDPAIAAEMPVASDAELNLLLSLQGAKSTAALRDLALAWNGDPERPGPLLLVSHYTNIEELTQFRVFEGEILVLDPKRDLQVLGYLRLKSAGPDVGHFADALASPLLEEAQALDMVDRYYSALNARDETLLQDVLSERWVVHGESPSLPTLDAAGFMDELSGFSSGFADGRFTVDDVYLADDVITVRGTITGRHTGTFYGIPATGRDITFGAIAVHRVKDGVIVESWQMADRATLMEKLTGEE